MINGSVTYEFFSFVHQGLGESLGVLNNLLGVNLELWGSNFLQLNGKSSNRHIMWSTLEHWENSKVDLLSVLNLVENNSGSWSSQTLVSCGGNNIAVLEWGFHQASCNKSTNVSDIAHKVSTDGVSDLSESWIIEVGWVSGSSEDEHLWLELKHGGSQGIIVNKPGLLVNEIGLGFEVNARSEIFLVSV